MRILKLKGKNEEVVLKQIQKEYGKNAVVIQTQKEQVKGHFRWFRSPRTVVTIAVKENDDLEEELAYEKEKTGAEEQSNQLVTKQDVSYDLLQELRQELGSLHQEIGELKRTSNIIIKEHVVGTEDERLLSHRIQVKLMNLGIKEEVCEHLLAQIKTEDIETFIRELYNAFVGLLIQKEDEKLPQVIFFIGSTGVGKTTTIAKLTAQLVLNEQKKVVLFTSDTYRIAAVEQLKTYADILGVDIEIIYDESELPQYIEKWKYADYILIDTAGRSHKNEEQVTELKALMGQIEEKQVFLVLNANTSPKDVRKIIETYEKAEKHFDLIITKLDETDEIGNIVNISFYAQKPIGYLAIGQNVPADIKTFVKQDYITELLGRLNND